MLPVSIILYALTFGVAEAGLLLFILFFLGLILIKFTGLGEPHNFSIYIFVFIVLATISSLTNAYTYTNFGSYQTAIDANTYWGMLKSSPPFSKSKINRQIKEYELADLIWCPSIFVQESLINNGVPKDKTFVSHLGVNISDFNVEESARTTSEPFVILFVGSICVQKGVHVLLEALLHADIPNTVMVFNGVADRTAKILLDTYYERLAKKNITVKIDPGDPRRYHKKASVFVLPSVHDAFGIVVPEAMAAGLPIIVSTNVGAKECIKHRGNGFVFTSGDHKELAEYINILFKSEVTRAEFAKVSHNLAKNCNVDVQNKKFLEILRCQFTGEENDLEY